MQVFVLDGFVTENVNMLLDINKLYSFLGRLEESHKRRLQMLTRRRKLLPTSLQKQVNLESNP